MKRRIKTIETNGKSREIVIYSKEEIQAQRDLNASLSLIFEDHTHENVCSFRKGRSTIGIVQEVARHTGQFRYALKLDVRDFFPSISRWRLAQQLGEIFHAKTKNSIMKYVCAGTRGIAQGSPLSPVLSNIYLFKFDEHISEYRDVFYRRYCDDILIMTNLDPAHILRVVEEQLSAHGLRLKREKTQIVETVEGFDYLGFHVNTSGYWITTKKVSEILKKINDAESRRQRKAIINGWWAYCTSTDFLPAGFNSVLLLVRSGKLGDAYGMIQKMNATRQLGAPQLGAHFKARPSRAIFDKRSVRPLRSLVRSAGMTAGLAIWLMGVASRVSL